MTSSKSNSWARRAAIILIVLVGMAGVANAGRKRLVVLELEGDKAEKFQADLVKLLKKSHTVISTSKWDSVADELGATKVTDANVKKVAKKLKIDGVISGSVQKRRDEYIIRLKLRAGSSGSLVGSQVNVKAEGPKLDSSAKSDLQDELFSAIDDLKSNRGGGGDDDEEEEEEEDKPKKGFSKKSSDDEDEDKPKKGFSKKSSDDEDEDKPSKKGFSKKSSDDEDEDKPSKKGFSKKSSDDEDEDKPSKKGLSKKASEDEDKPSKKGLSKKASDDEEEEDPLPQKDKAKGKKVAAREDEEEEEEEEGDGVEEEVEVGAMKGSLAHSPGNRAVDATAGLSFTMRRMNFTFDPNRTAKPPGYKGTPVAGAVVDVTLYPMAIGHKSDGMAKNFGVTVLYDKVLLINSKNPDGMSLETSQARYAFGAVFRYPLGKSATAPVVGASLRYGRQNFTIAGDSGIPNVNYTIIDPQLFFKYPVSTKIALNASFGYMLITGTGGIQKADEYGAATVSGVEGELSGDYMLTGNIFARAGIKFDTIGFAFKGTGAKAMDGAVPGARDTYIGASVTAGYVF